MADRVEEYQDEHNLTDAEAIRRLVTAGINQQDQPTRAEIAADLEEITDSVDGLADDLDDLADDPDDDTDGEIHRAASVGTVISLVVLAVAALIGVLIMSGVL
jgi:hypothetical protein